MYYAFLNYKGRTAAELQAPKPGSLYTIRPMVEENTGNALLVHVDKSNETYATKEVYNGGVVRAGEDEKSYDPRGVWVFEGTAGADGFLALENLKVKNLHTQCYLTALGDAASAVNEADPAQVALGTIGGCITMFKVGEKFMNRTAVTPTLSYDHNRDFWGDAVTTYPSALDESINTGKTEGNIPSTEGNVRCKRLDVEVETAGNVVVTFEYKGGEHKINILGVELLGNDGKMVYADYHYGRAGGDHVNNVYTIKGVVAGAYTMNCYVFEPNGGDELTSHKGHFEIDGVVTYSGEGKIVNDGSETTKWIVEEILDPEESVYYETTIEEGYSTLMLGFDAKIPEGVEAYTSAIDGIVVDKKYLSMTQYEGSILPANTPVVLKSSDEGTKTSKFYISISTIAGEQRDDNYLRGSLYHTVVSTGAIETEVGASINIYMLQSGKTGPKMYWIYEEYDADGDLVDENGNKDPNGGSNDAGKHVLCKANKAYIVIKSGEANGKGSFMFMLNRGGATGIDDAESEVEEVETIYDLQGRRLDEITHPGVYIVNGRKVMVK